MNDRQDGFTLVELLITIVILGAITVTLGSSVVLGLRTTFDAEERTVEGNDGRNLAEAFVPDVQNAVTISTTATGCGGSGTRIQFSWTDGTAVQVAWVVRTTGSLQQLVRVRCGSGSTTEQVVVRSLASPNPVVVNCPAGGSSVTITANQSSIGPLSVSSKSRTTGACA